MVLKLYLIANIIGFVCSLFGFIYGAVVFFRPKKAVYAQMITLSFGCSAFGRLFYIVRLLSSGFITGSVQLGFFGIVGGFMFFFSSNFGLMDTLIDDKSKEYMKYRLIAIIAPALFVTTYAVLFIPADITLMWKILGGVITVPIALSTYFNLKHLIFPDVDYGVAKCLRPYNFLVLVYSVAILLETVALSRDNALMALVCCIVTGLISVAVMPLVVRGVKKWKI